MKILLAVSGGIDSMYLANRAPELFPGASFAVAHCNFTLRGEESDGDEEFVRNWCRERGIECFVKRFDTQAYAGQKGISIEMAARELRYAWFGELCGNGFDAVAVAHNANDNAETLILNLLRGTGTKGIRGMSPRREGFPTILRPMLSTERKAIREWMESNGKKWREDSSNEYSEYKRNVIRNEVFPIFSRINPSFVSSLGEDMARFREVDDIAEEYFNSARIRVTDSEDNILCDKLLSFKHWKYILYRLLEGSGTNPDQFDRLVHFLKNPGQTFSGKAFGPVRTASGRKLIISRQKCTRELRIEHLDINAIGSLKQPEGVIILDADAIPVTPVIRKWREGDWLQPLGMKGKKKLSDLFTDLKWSAFDKEEALVIEKDGSHVAALLCSRIDDSVKVTGSTEKVIRFSYSITNS